MVLRILTSQNTRIETRKSMIQELLPEVVVKCLLRTIVRLVPRACGPVALVEREVHRPALRRTPRGRLRTRRARLWGLEDGLVPLHAHETFRAARDLYCHDRYLAYP